MVLCYPEPLYPSCWLEIQQGDFLWERHKTNQDDDISKDDDIDDDSTKARDEESRQSVASLTLNNISIQIFKVNNICKYNNYPLSTFLASPLHEVIFHFWPLYIRINFLPMLNLNLVI